MDKPDSLFIRMLDSFGRYGIMVSWDTIREAVDRRFETLQKRASAELMTLGEYSDEDFEVNGKYFPIITWHDTRDGVHRVVMTCGITGFIGLTVYARGVLIQADGQMREMTNREIAEFDME